MLKATALSAVRAATAMDRIETDFMAGNRKVRVQMTVMGSDSDRIRVRGVKKYPFVGIKRIPCLKRTYL